VKDLIAYRNELEHDYDPAMAFHSDFPVTFVSQVSWLMDGPSSFTSKRIQTTVAFPDARR
jgi:hypothetical protein